MTTYAINTKTSEYTTHSAASAARVFAAKQRNGKHPAAYAIVDAGKGVSVRHVALSGNVTAMAKLLAAAAR